jgi:hypothetical protein
VSLHITTEEAMNHLKQAMREDPGYAWSWHCNVAMASVQEGMGHTEANKAASRFMKWAFDAEGYEPQ